MNKHNRLKRMKICLKGLTERCEEYDSDLNLLLGAETVRNMTQEK